MSGEEEKIKEYKNTIPFKYLAWKVERLEQESASRSVHRT